jgi:hypothetical protein
MEKGTPPAGVPFSVRPEEFEKALKFDGQSVIIIAERRTKSKTAV